MRKNGRKNPAASENLARKHYNLRQMEKYIKWSVETRGYLKWKDLVEYQSIYKIVEYWKKKIKQRGKFQ